jgi:hypothetical protein
MTESEWLECADPDVLLKWLQKSKRHQVSGRKLRLFSCACCRRIWHLLSTSSREAVEIAEAYADGLVSEKKVEQTRDSLKGDGQGAVGWALWLPSMTYLEVTRPETAARSVAGYAAMGLDDEATESAEQCGLLRDVVGNPYRPAGIEPTWLSWNKGTVNKLAQAIYQKRAFDEMPILADALEEAGCSNPEILAHCRQPAQHCRGCWVVDQIIGKS